MCQSNRESILYSGNVVQRDVDTALRIMSQSLLIPDYNSPEVRRGDDGVEQAVGSSMAAAWQQHGRACGA